jgi:hypothetical protein
LDVEPQEEEEEEEIEEPCFMTGNIAPKPLRTMRKNNSNIF